MQSEHAADRPTDDPQNDAFQRADFARRIAETLFKNRTAESLVVGLYGRWGEGKSSVLGFIRHYLAQHTERVSVLTFNPWQFPREDQLLLHFFGQMAATLDAKLQTTGEKFAGIFGKHIAPMLPTFSLGVASTDPGKSLAAIAELYQPGTETYRQRIEDALAASGKRLVVIIDDLDRLEKAQVQAVIRLVKLTADFKHTTYLLAFDDIAVAKAIGEMYENDPAKMEDAGRSFLEKIVQVPLRLPRARQDQLLNYCIDQIETALTQTAITLNEEEGRRFIDGFRAGVLPVLKTPRMAVRYANTARFYLPLLAGEVNTVDLLLVEAMQVFYPELYGFVASNQDLLAGAVPQLIYHSASSNAHAGEDGRKQAIEAALSIYEGDTQVAARNLLIRLFPVARQVLSSGFTWNSPEPLAEQALYNRQALASYVHFPRYFSYTVLSGDVADGEFAALLDERDGAQWQHATRIAGTLRLPIFLQRLAYRLEHLTQDQRQALITTLVRFGPTATVARPGHLAGRGEVEQLSTLLLEILDGLPEQEKAARILPLMQVEATFALAFELYRRLRRRHKPQSDSVETDGAPLSAEAWQQVQQALIGRARSEAGDQPLYRTHAEYADFLLHELWPLTAQQPLASTYVLGFLETDPAAEIPAFLEAMAPQVSSGNRYYLGGLSKQRVEQLAAAYGSRLYELSKQVLNEEVVTVYPGDEVFDEPTREDRVRQFVYHYQRITDATRSTN